MPSHEALQNDPTLARASTIPPALWPLAVLAACLWLLGCSSFPASKSDEDTEPTSGPPVATVNGASIGLDTVDGQIKQDLFDEAFGSNPSKLYDARHAMLLELIDGRLLAQAAEEAGQQPEAWLDTAIRDLPPIGDDQIQALFDANRERLPEGATAQEYAPQLRAHLESLQRGQIMQQLRAAADIDITLPRERVTVAAVGPSRGPEDAPITIVEFSDFQCPFCARALPTLEAVHTRYPEDVRVVYRHLPLSFHPEARMAAHAAVCADGQGEFWDYHDVLFENQKKLARPDLIVHAEALGLDPATFEACLDAPETAAVVEADMAAARALGATGTPTFFINGIRLTGAQPFERFEALIEEERSRATPPDAS